MYRWWSVWAVKRKRSFLVWRGFFILTNWRPWGTVWIKSGGVSSRLCRKLCGNVKNMDITEKAPGSHWRVLSLSPSHLHPELERRLVQHPTKATGGQRLWNDGEIHKGPPGRAYADRPKWGWWGSKEGEDMRIMTEGLPTSRYLLTGKGWKLNDCHSAWDWYHFGWKSGSGWDSVTGLRSKWWVETYIFWVYKCCRLNVCVLPKFLWWTS